VAPTQPLATFVPYAANYTTEPISPSLHMANLHFSATPVHCSLIERHVSNPELLAQIIGSRAECAGIRFL